MIRERLIAWDRHDDPDFRWRGGEVSRVEGFSDAVFGFALTLLVVSVEVPHSFDELTRILRGFPAFAICFVILLGLWRRHYHFFRRYGLLDSTTLRLNGALLFVVVFFIYPLKFLFVWVTDLLAGPISKMPAVNGSGQIRSLFVIYSIGFVAAHVIYTLLYAHAWRSRDALSLDPLERSQTRLEITINALMAAVGALSILLALVLPAGVLGLTGANYVLLLPVNRWHRARAAAERRRLSRPAAGTTDVPPEAASCGQLE
jgi:uncharacterized membrane protein